MADYLSSQTSRLEGHFHSLWALDSAPPRCWPSQLQAQWGSWHPPWLCSYTSFLFPPQPASLIGGPTESSPGPWGLGFASAHTASTLDPTAHFSKLRETFKTPSSCCLFAPCKHFASIPPFTPPSKCVCQKLLHNQGTDSDRGAMTFPKSPNAR